MNSKFIVAVRKATRDLPPTNEVIDSIANFRIDLVKQAEAIILKNENLGKRFLISNIREINAQLNYTEVVVKHQLEEMQKKGLDDYDTDFWNTKELAIAIDEALDYLNNLWEIYFEESADRNGKTTNNTITQTARNIYNIEKIDTANFS